MNIISLESISKSYGEKILFNDISFGINEGEKIGLIGVNGTGKSTLLKLVAGITTAEKGNVVKSNNIKIGYLTQEIEFKNDATVIEHIFNSDTPIMKIIREYELIISKSLFNEQDDELNKRIISLTEKMDNLNAWEKESEAKTILTRLGIKGFEQKMGELSGGQRKRVAMAAALINTVDLLILDEPTNHLDNDTIDWLEGYLKSKRVALLMITHDRYFLDRVVDRIVELDNGNIYSYNGNYTKYLELKLQREEEMASKEHTRQNIIRNELKWIKRGAKARGTKQKARIDRFEELNETSYEIKKENVDISIGVGQRLGNKVIELINVSKKYGDKNVINDFSYIFSKESRIGIIGLNGLGKSTLVNIITGRINADSGIVDIGETVKIGNFLQENVEMDETLKVIEYIKQGGEYVKTIEGESITASQMLERFLFPPKLQWTTISKLSGGEKRRLYLLRVLIEMPNVLILDEPTNDLDIQTLSILEEYIDNFLGTVIIVSHDRYFLDRTVSDVLSFKGEGVIEKYTGNYSEYIEYIKNNNKDLEEKNNKRSEATKEHNKPKRDKVLKFTFKEQKEFEQIDEIIEEIENNLKAVRADINNAGSDFLLLKDLSEKEEKLQKELDEKIERWTYLNDLAERIEESK